MRWSAGLARIEGRPVVVGAEDFSVQGGSIGFATHAKRLRFARLARQERVPLVMLLDGAGERASNALSRHPYAPNDMQELAGSPARCPASRWSPAPPPVTARSRRCSATS